MVYQQVSIPRFNPDVRSNSTFITEGLLDTSPPGGAPEAGQYRRFPIVSDTRLDVTIPANTVDMWTSRGQTDQSTLAFTEDNAVHAVHLLVSGRFAPQPLVPTVRSIPFEFEEDVWLMTERGDILKLVGAQMLPQSDSTQNLQSVLSTLGVADEPITSVNVWQGRVFISVLDLLVWSDAFNVDEWRASYVDAATGVTVVTNAGHTQVQTSVIKDVIPIARRLLIFGEDIAFDVETSNVEFQIAVRELYRGVNYRGGGVNHRGEVHILTDSGVRVFGGDGSSELVSLDIDSSVTRVISQTTGDLSVVAVGDLLVWSADEHLIYYSTKWRRFAPLQPYVGARLGDYRLSQTTVDELAGSVDGLDGTINDLSSPQESEPVVISGADIFPFRYAERVSVAFNVARTAGNMEMMVREVAMPELAEFTVQVRSLDDTSWGVPVVADSLGRCKINERHTSPAIRIETGDAFDTLNYYAADVVPVRIG